MKVLEYKIIKSQEQYDKYCDILENLTSMHHQSSEDELELLTLLIEKWDREHNTLTDADPVQLLKNLMIENELKAKDLVEIVGISKATISKILNFHKGLS